MNRAEEINSLERLMKFLDPNSSTYRGCKKRVDKLLESARMEEEFFDKIEEYGSAD